MASEMKFSLVEFVEGVEVEIVLTKDVIIDGDRSKLNGEEWDAETEVTILWHKKGSKSAEKHVAKILRFASKSNQ